VHIKSLHIIIIIKQRAHDADTYTQAGYRARAAVFAVQVINTGGLYTGKTWHTCN